MDMARKPLPPEARRTIMDKQLFRKNRAEFPWDKLTPYRGQWVAFSADGRRIVAAGESLTSLEEKLAALGQDPQQVVLEGIPGPEDDVMLGAEEWRCA
jgi:hypothetical protein